MDKRYQLFCAPTQEVAKDIQTKPFLRRADQSLTQLTFRSRVCVYVINLILICS